MLRTWLAARLDYGGIVRRGLCKIFPDHWSFLLGEVALFAFVVLVVTGLFLGAYYVPSIAPSTYEGAFASLRGAVLPRAYVTVVWLTNDVPAGSLIRRMHHFAAHVFVGAILLHTLRIYFGGAFRRPREINWLIGVGLFLLAIIEGFTGYALPFDQRGGTALRMAYTQAKTLPWIGHFTAPLLLGPVFPSDVLLGRIQIVHVALLPLLIAGLIAVHVLIVVLQTHTQRTRVRPASTSIVGSPLWPEQAARTAATGFATAALVVFLSALFPVDAQWHDGPYRIGEQSGTLLPDWFLFFSEGAYRILPPIEWHVLGTTITGPFIGGVLLLAVLFVATALYPWLDRRIYGWGAADEHEVEPARARPFRTALGVAALTFLVVLSCGTLNEWLAGKPERIYAVNEVLRNMTLAAPPLVGFITWAALRRRRHGASPAPTPRRVTETHEQAPAGRGRA